MKDASYHCKNCGIVMVRAEWITGDYCWGCRAVLGKNWVDSRIPVEQKSGDEEEVMK